MRLANLLLVFFTFILSLTAQVEFYDATAQVLGSDKIFSTICVGVDDLDGDNRDDLILLDKGTSLRTYVQSGPNKLFVSKNHGLVSSNGDWAIVTGDLDNDGRPEIIVSGAEDGSNFLFFDGIKYTIQAATESIFSQNTNLVDLNGDGFLDFFVCNDDGENRTYLNNGSGGMTYKKLIDYQTSPEDDMSGNYSSVFTDIDADGDLDLYIGKCRGGVDDPKDRRRINTLYINNGDGTYQEKAEEFGIDIGWQTWSVDFGDVDNDGDMDLLVGNHDAPHDLYLNDGSGHFDRFELLPGGYSSFAFQTFFSDFDNNGWLDIFITDPSATFILFNNEMSFTRRDLFKGTRKAFTAACGDFNDDGYIDLYCGFASSFTNPSNVADKVMFNQRGVNDFIDITLEGTISNRDAIGAKLKLYTNKGFQFREIHAGKSYGIMLSTMVHFGLGIGTEIDSMIINWPSGLVSKHYDIQKLNTHYKITEDGCVSQNIAMPNLQLCDGMPVTAALPDGYDSYLWSNGMTNREIVISAPGVFHASLSKDGCIVQSAYFSVTQQQDIAAEDVLGSGNIVACEGEIVELKAPLGVSYLWSNGATTQNLKVVDPDQYQVTLTTNCGEIISNEIDVDFVAVIDPGVEGQTIIEGERATLAAEGDNINWFQNKYDLLPISSGKTFTTPILYDDHTYFVSDQIMGFLGSKSLMQNVPLNTNADSTFSINEIVSFEVESPILLKSIKVRTQTTGLRKFLLTNGISELFSLELNLSVGVNTLNLNLDLERGNYFLLTDENVNQTSLGTVHPSLSYSTLYKAADKEISGIFHIEENVNYPGVTSYYFDWKIDYGRYHCGPMFPVLVKVDEYVAVSDLSSTSTIFPNPSSGLFHLSTDIQGPFEVEVLNLNGMKMINSILADKGRIALDLSDLSVGIYLLRIVTKKGIEVKKVYKH